LEDCARQAGLEAGFVSIEAIGMADDRSFVDDRDRRIELLFKLYPWEWLFQDRFGADVRNTSTRFLEPPWKAVLSNKGLLPFLWEMARGHPNLLPAYFEDDPRKGELGSTFARKPLYSREGANVLLVRDAQVLERDEGPYGAEGYVRQALVDLPAHDGHHAVIGSWIVGDEPAGICVRESRKRITSNRARFVPHVILGP
jgi:glutathionylspermidine synthase